MEENDEVTTSRNNNTQQHNEDGEDQDDAEEEDSGVYISVSGAGLRAKLNARDLRRIDKETEFDQRFESLKFLSYPTNSYLHPRFM